MQQSEQNSRNNFNSLTLIQFFWEWRKILFIVSVSAIVVSTIISFLITPKYKSTVVMFPTASNSISKALLSENSGVKQDIMEFGEEEQAEQLLQVLNSSIIRDKVTEKYDLFNHYNISPNSDSRHTALINEYTSNIKFSRTKYMAVEISVMDKNPQLAADIANDISLLLDSLMNSMQKERAIKGFQIVENAYLSLKNEIKVKEDSLTILRKKGVHDYESQTEMLYETFAKELAIGNQRGIKAIQDKLDTLAKYGGFYVSIRDELEHEKKQLSAIKAKYEEAKVDANEFLPHKFVVDKAYKAEKRCYPVRWLIVLVSTFSTFFLSLILIIIFQNVKEITSKKSSL